MRKLYTILFATTLFSCGTRVNYLGTSYAPTKNVDVYVSQAAVKKPFDVIGKGYVQQQLASSESVEVIQRKAVEKAKLKGADAVIIEDYYLVNKTSSVTTSIDSLKKTSMTSNTNPVVSSGFTILFLKYKVEP
jgi:hypothetical protein